MVKELARYPWRTSDRLERLLLAGCFASLLLAVSFWPLARAVQPEWLVSAACFVEPERAQLRWDPKAKTLIHELGSLDALLETYRCCKPERPLEPVEFYDDSALVGVSFSFDVSVGGFGVTSSSFNTGEAGALTPLDAADPSLGFDPWGHPWRFRLNALGHVQVYSAGPNGRDDATTGDDVLVRFAWWRAPLQVARNLGSLPFALLAALFAWLWLSARILRTPLGGRIWGDLAGAGGVATLPGVAAGVWIGFDGPLPEVATPWLVGPRPLAAWLSLTVSCFLLALAWRALQRPAAEAQAPRLKRDLLLIGAAALAWTGCSLGASWAEGLLSKRRALFLAGEIRDAEAQLHVLRTPEWFAELAASPSGLPPRFPAEHLDDPTLEALGDLGDAGATALAWTRADQPGRTLRDALSGLAYGTPQSDAALGCAPLHPLLARSPFGAVAAWAELVERFPLRFTSSSVLHPGLLAAALGRERAARILRARLHDAREVADHVLVRQVRKRRRSTIQFTPLRVCDAAAIGLSRLEEGAPKPPKSLVFGLKRFRRQLHGRSVPSPSFRADWDAHLSLLRETRPSKPPPSSWVVVQLRGLLPSETARTDYNVWVNGELKIQVPIQRADALVVVGPLEPGQLSVTAQDLGARSALSLDDDTTTPHTLWLDADFDEGQIRRR